MCVRVWVVCVVVCVSVCVFGNVVGNMLTKSQLLSSQIFVKHIYYTHGRGEMLHVPKYVRAFREAIQRFLLDHRDILQKHQ